MQWFAARGWEAFPFQKRLWKAYHEGKSGLLNAPTGSGKTMAVWLPTLMPALEEQLKRQQKHPEEEPGKVSGMRVLWITPLRALARDTEAALRESAEELGLNWEIARRTGDSTSSQRQRMKRRPPQCLITTPESLHVMISQKDNRRMFSQLDAVIVDEWHELLSSKRGVLTELGLAYLRDLRPELRTWGVSATIENTDQALEVLTGPHHPEEKRSIIKAPSDKKYQFETILPDRPEAYSWAGHLGTALLKKVLPIIEKSRSTLLFTNTRTQAEIWYQKLLDAEPELAGRIALHHGSLDTELRKWVEDALQADRLKLVVCTSSLDLGVDFAPVETVIQVGSPKGVGRFLQRAGRSGHQPGAESRLYMLPTHALEILESAALQAAAREGKVEPRPPYDAPLDVLVQFLCTLAVGEGFYPAEALRIVRNSYAYTYLGEEEWDWAMDFLTHGGDALKRYEDYSKITKNEDGRYVMEGRRKAQRHRLSIGTITADPALKVKFVSGGFIGTVEESFIARLKKGDTFLFAGRYLEFVRLRELTVHVRASKSTKGAVTRWVGGRMQLSTQLSEMMRITLEKAASSTKSTKPELAAMRPLLKRQAVMSALPDAGQLLIERIKSREGWHLFFYPMEGRLLHEGLAALLAWRMSKITPISFSIAMNDYGLELLSPTEPPLNKALENGLFESAQLYDEVIESINASEMARRHFREIARIAGLTFQGFPGKRNSGKHLQANSSLLFDVFQQHDEQNLLLRQSYNEIMFQQIEFGRLQRVLEALQHKELILTEPKRFTPFSFPIMVDRLRARLSSEKLSDRIKRMKMQLEKET